MSYLCTVVRVQDIYQNQISLLYCLCTGLFKVCSRWILGIFNTPTPREIGWELTCVIHEIKDEDSLHANLRCNWHAMTVWEMFKTIHQRHFQWTNLTKTHYCGCAWHVCVERDMKNDVIRFFVRSQNFKAAEVIFVVLLAKNHRENILKRPIYGDLLSSSVKRGLRVILCLLLLT